jgi:uncharacterized protein (DUF58 family)
MKTIRIVFYAAMGFCLLAGMYTGLRVYYFVFFAQLCSILVMLLVNLWTIYAFTFKQELHKKACVKGERALLHLEIKNERPVPLSLMEVHLDVVSLREKQDLMFSLAPFTGKEFDLSLALPYRGIYRVGMTAIKVTDIFGLTTLRFDMRWLSYYRMAELIVLPKAEIGDAVNAGLVDSKLFGSANLRQTEQGENITSAGLYVKGDQLKRIHWKKSAQQGRLYVKQYELPERERVLMLLDSSINKLDGEDALIYADTLCECAANIALHSLLRERIVQLVTSAAVRERHEYVRITELESLQHFLAALRFCGSENLPAALTHACAVASTARALFVLTRETDPDLNMALERALTVFPSVTLILCGGAHTSGRIHTLYLEPGCDVAQSLEGIG